MKETVKNELKAKVTRVLSAHISRTDGMRCHTQNDCRHQISGCVRILFREAFVQSVHLRCDSERNLLFNLHAI